MKIPFANSVSIIISFASILLLLVGCATEPETAPPQVEEKGAAAPAFGVQFVDVARDAGLDFVHVSGSPEQRYILESMSPGAAFFDYDDDGYLDIFMVNSSRIRENTDDATNRLYRNVEIGSTDQRRRGFQDVTEEAGLRRSGWGMGCAAGDYDNDGDVDLYVTYWGPNILYRNEGDGTFTEVTKEAGVGNDDWGSSAAFGDVDGDGYLDLYVTNYLVFDIDDPPGGGLPCSDWKGLDVYCGPHGMIPQPNVLYRNEGNGRFADVTAEAGLSQHRQASLGVVFGDYDNDGDQDFYVANDGYPNLLYRNEGDWNLEEVAAFAGAAYSEDGRAQAGMGVAAGDYDNDGDLDIYVTHFSDDINTIYQNQGDGNFIDNTAGAGMGGQVRPFLSWSTGFFDADNDGWLDVFVANGHIYPQVDVHPSGIRYAQGNLLFHNEGGRFRNVSDEAGPGFAAVNVTRGGALGDYDNDGDLDLLMMNLNDPPNLLHNFGGNSNNWLGLKLLGTESNRDALGARVKLFSGNRVQMREVQRGYGYQSQHDVRLLFGLGDQERVERVEISWPSGLVQTLEDPGLRRYLVVHEGSPEPVASYVGETSEESFAPSISSSTEKISTAKGKSQYAIDPNWTAGDHYRKGVELYNFGRYHEALAAFRTSIHLEPDSIEVYYSLGVTLYSGLGLSAEAAAVLEEAMARDSSWTQVCQLLGVAYMDLDRTDEAIELLERARQLEPNAWQGHNRLGLAHLRRGDMAAAGDAFREASRKAPWMPHPHLNLARVYERQGQSDRAEWERQIFEQLRPTQKQVTRYLDNLESYPEDVEARCLLGQAYLLQGRPEDAQTCFQQAIRTDSSYAPAHYGLGAILHYQNRLTEAISAYEHASRLQPDLVGAFADLGQAHHQTGHLGEATAAYSKALALRPDLAAVRTRLGMVYATQRRLPEATEAFQTALKIDSTLVEARDALGRVYSAEGRYEAAIRQFERVLEQAPQYPKAAERLRLARQKLAERQNLPAGR
jgi:enediyne biosynthesis protein E4